MFCFFFPHNEIWIGMVWIVGSCQQIPQLPATTDQSVAYLNHNSTDLLARADINPKPSSQRGGTSGNDVAAVVVVGANSDTGSNKQRC